MLRLDDAFQKLDRGKEQLIDFYGKVNVVFDSDKVLTEIKRQPHPKPTKDTREWIAFTLYISSAPRVSKRDCILLGQAIQCFRTSLDYLAWNLVGKHGRNKLKEKEKRRIAFPMADNRVAFWNNKQPLPNLSHHQRAFFERYQPYRLSSVGRTMRHLKNLSNYEKHRVIVTTPIWPDTGEVNINYRESQDELIKTIRHFSIGKEIEAGTKLMTFVLAGSDPHVHIDTKLTIVPMFPKSIVKPPPPLLAIPAQQVTNDISAICTKILTEATNYF